MLNIKSYIDLIVQKTLLHQFKNARRPRPQSRVLRVFRDAVVHHAFISHVSIWLHLLPFSLGAFACAVVSLLCHNHNVVDIIYVREVECRRSPFVHLIYIGPAPFVSVRIEMCSRAFASRPTLYACVIVGVTDSSSMCSCCRRDMPFVSCSQ